MGPRHQRTHRPLPAVSFEKGPLEEIPVGAVGAVPVALFHALSAPEYFALNFSHWL